MAISTWFANLTKKVAPEAGHGTGRDGSKDAAMSITALGIDGEYTGKEIVDRRHIDFLEHQISFRWLLDSYEGGDRYRNAVYGPDRKGLPCRNLFRHPREYPDPQAFPTVYGGFAGGLAATSGEALPTGLGPLPGQLGAYPGATAADDAFECRRARTPVPAWVSSAVRTHLSKVYSKPVERTGNAKLTDWWKDVDGKGTPIDAWMKEVVAPLLEVLGCLPICLDHPAAPPGAKVETRADELDLGLDKCVASYILPQNLVWWRTDSAGRYVECLVREYADPSDRVDIDAKGNIIDPNAADKENKIAANWRQSYERFRWWTPGESILLNFQGDKILDRRPHPYGRPPIIMLKDQIKHRTPTIGQSRQWITAELMREFYNKNSELILSDTLQAHALLSGPEDFCKADNTLSIGPGYVLPKKKNPESGAYEGWEYVNPPKEGAQSLRLNKADLRDEADRENCLIKPAGSTQGSGAGSGGSTVAQSGLSKQMDAQTGHDLCVELATTMAKAERQLAEFAMLVLEGRPPTPAELEELSIVYSKVFDLQSADQLMGGLSKMQTAAASAGNMPETEGAIVKTGIRQILPGRQDSEYEGYDEEVDQHMERAAKQKQAAREARQDAIEDRSNVLAGSGTAEADAGTDPTGQSGSTLVGSTEAEFVE
jgi:hypothetical protein